jgi:PAS domain S-box-containing protein
LTVAGVLFLTLLIGIAAATLAAAFHVWFRQPVPGSRTALLISLAGAEWLLCYAAELMSVGVQAKNFWNQMQYVGIVTVIPAWVAFVIQYSGHERWLTWRTVALMIIEPLIVLLLVFTNSAHGLIWRGVDPAQVGYLTILHRPHGIGYWVHSVYSYGIYLFAIWLLLRMLAHAHHLYRRQVRALLIASSIPVAANLAMWADLSPAPYVDLTVLSFPIASGILMWSIVRLRVGDLLPVARGLVVERMSDGVIVLDRRDRIVDLNLVAQRMIGESPGVLGQPVGERWPDWPGLSPTPEGETASREVRLGPEGQQRIHDMRVTPLFDWRNRFSGRIVVLRDITARKQTEESLKRHAAQLEALRDVGLELASELELDIVIHSIVARAIELVNAEAGGLFLVRPERGVLELTTVVGSGNLPPPGSTLEPGGGMAGKIWASGKPCIVGNYQEWDGRSSSFTPYDLHSSVGVPICWGDQCLGVLNINTTHPRAFSQNDVELLSLFATQSAIAIRNAQLLKTEREQRELAEALEEAASAVGSTLDPDQVLDRILEQVARVVSGDAFNIMLIEDDIARVVRSRGYDRFDLQDLIPALRFRIVEVPGLRWMMESRKPIVVPDTRADPEWIQVSEMDWLRSYVGAPILVGGATVGFLNVDGIRSGQFGAADMRRLEAFANHVAAAIENARLYQELQQYADQLEQRVQERTAEVQAQYAQLEAILRSAADGIIVADAAGDVLQANPVAETWLYETLSAEDADRLHWTMRRLVGQASDRPKEVLELTEFDLELRVAPISEPGMEAAAAVVTIHDITHLKALERMKSRFVTNVSHELRTPVTAIKLYVELMRRSPEEWQRYLDVLEREADQQARLVENILRVSRADAGQLPLKLRPVQLERLSQQVVTHHQFLARRSELTLEHRWEEQVVAMADPDQLNVVLNNLVRNAIQYTPPGGEVTVVTGQQSLNSDQWATVTVSDTGVGIPEDELPRIFDRFFRGKRPQDMQSPGTGLGLAIVKETIAQHGGNVTVESTPDQGTTFTVWLPLAE